jgi:ribonuclease BN (tRNA processing enzyme)
VTDVPIRLTVLGSATPYPHPDNPCSGYLVAHGGTRIWVDAGSGTLGPLLRHCPLDRLTGIWVSHLHADHAADLLTAFYAALYADIRLAAPIPLFAPPGTADRLAHFLTNGPTRSPIESAFRVEELSDGHRATLGSLELSARAVAHGIPAFGLRIDAGAATLAYSGDCGPCPSLVELAAGCDALLCEAGAGEDTEGGPAEGEPAVHHTPEQAGATGRAAGAGRLIVTHVGPPVTPEQAVTRAGSRYPGPVEYAVPGQTFTVG